MTDPSDTVSKADLHAFVDGRLDDGRRRQVAQYLAENPDAAARVAAYRAQKEALRALLDPVLEEPVPGRLKPPAGIARPVPLGWAAAASIVLMVASGALGWYGGSTLGAPGPAGLAVAHQAAVAHAVFTPQRRHPVEVTGAEEAHLVKWLSKVLGQPLKAPRLTGLGYSLVGGRLLSAPDGPAAQFMYENPDGKRLTLYVVADATRRQTTAFRYADEKGVAVFHWINGPLGYALSAEMARPELLGIARAVHGQLSP